MPIIEDDELADLLAQFDQPVKLAATTAPVPVDDEPPVIRVTERPAQIAGPPSGEDDDGDFLDAAALLSSMGAHQEQNVPDIKKAWMNYHEFVVIDSIELLSKVVDQAFVTGKCALDLETEGLDNRIYLRDPSTIRGDFEEYWDGERPDRILQTVHKIVGYCLSPDGYTGYYVPVRHTAEDSNNLDVVEAGKLIKKLCRAAQPVITEEGRLVDPLASPLIKPAKVKIFFWHAKFDQEFLLPVTGIDFWHPESFEDGMLVYYCIYTNDKNLSLKDKSKKELRVLDKQGKEVRALINPDPSNSKHELVTENPRGVTLPYEMIELKDLFVRGRDIQFGTLRPEEARYYACSDAICTFLHCDNPVITSAIKNPKFAGVYRIEKQVVQVLRWMERNRIKIDHEYVRKLITEAKAEAKQYRDQIVALADQYGFKGFDPNSTQQLSGFLFGDSNGLNLPKPDKTGNELRNQYKTDADTLEKLVENNPDINPILLTLVKYRQVEKVIGTYLEGMLNNCDENSELRYQFKQTGAPTGRFTAPAGDPAHGYGGIPIHGIPSTYDDKKPKVATALRQAFVARDGYTMVKVDYAGEELRIVTNLSAEPVWTDEFLHGSGDLHSITARAFFGQEITKQQRQQGKIANFSLVYGGGTMAIMRATKCSQQEAARRKSAFDKSLPRFAEWVKEQKVKVKRDKGVFTAFGRWMAVPDVDSPDKAVVAACERYSLNYPIQGTGADIMKMSMVILYKEFHKQGWIQDNIARFMLTVHDEIVFEVKHENLVDVMPVIERIMTEPARMVRWKVPLEVEPLIDQHWDPHYDYHKIMKGYIPEKGKKPKDTDVPYNGRYYQEVPPWLKGILIPEYMKEGGPPPAPPSPQEPPPTKEEPVQHRSEPTPPQVEVADPPVQPKISDPPPRVSVPPSNGNGKAPTEIFRFHLKDFSLTRRSIEQVQHFCKICSDSNGKVLHLLHSGTNATLVSPELNIKVNPDKFEVMIETHNL